MLASCPVENRPDGAPRLYGKLKIGVIPGTLAARIYRQAEVTEDFTCNYELNPAYRSIIEASGLIVSGVTEEGGARIVELPGHRFFIATGFVPQLNSEETRPHPLLVAYLKATLEFKESQSNRGSRG